MSDESPKPPPQQPTPVPQQPVPQHNWQDPPKIGVPQPGSNSTIIDTMIPSKNTDALLSYYMGLFAIIPCVGLFIGPASLVFGSRALKSLKANPTIAGGTHAKVGIGCGSVGLLFNLLIVAFAIAIAVSSAK